jgi:hypothetical protein
MNRVLYLVSARIPNYGVYVMSWAYINAEHDLNL